MLLWLWMLLASKKSGDSDYSSDSRLQKLSSRDTIPRLSSTLRFPVATHLNRSNASLGRNERAHLPLVSEYLPFVSSRVSRKQRRLLRQLKSRLTSGSVRWYEVVRYSFHSNEPTVEQTTAFSAEKVIQWTATAKQQQRTITLRCLGNRRLRLLRHSGRRFRFYRQTNDAK
jgi:hypothetical protein